MRKNSLFRRMLACVAVTVIAFATAPQFAYGETKDIKHDVDGDGIVENFVPWESAISLPSEMDCESTGNYNYYLTKDIELTDTYVIDWGKTISIDLCGHKITMVGKDVSGVIKKGTVIQVINDNTVFNLYDSKGSNGECGIITGGVGNSYIDLSISEAISDGGGVAVKLEGTFNMYGGNISENDAGLYGYGGGVVIYHGAFNMYGGTISNNTAYLGGGVFTYDEFVMSGGTIEGNIAPYGAGVYAYEDNYNADNYNGSVEIKGSAKISTNHAKNTDMYPLEYYEYIGGNGQSVREYIYPYGGGLCLIMAETTISEQAVIRDNSAHYGGGISNYGAEVKINSGASIVGNESIYGGGGIYNDEEYIYDNNDNYIDTVTGNVFVDKNAYIKENISRGYGGGIYNLSGIITVQGMVCENESRGDGGGIYNSDELEVSKNSIISNNSSERYGGGIFNFGSFQLKDNASIADNKAKYLGGGVLNIADMYLAGGIDISNNQVGIESDFEDSNLVHCERYYVDSHGNTTQFDYSMTVNGTLSNKNPIGVSVYNLSSNATQYKLEESDTGNSSDNDAVKGIGLDGNEIEGGWLITNAGYKNYNGSDSPDLHFKSEDPNRILQTSKDGEVYLKLHTHEWQYTASGDKVTALCVKADNIHCQYKNEGVSLKLEAKDMTYNGEWYNKATVDNKITDLTGAVAGEIYYEGISGTNYSSTTAPPVNTGVYKAKVIIGGEMAIAEFEIHKRENTITYDTDGKIEENIGQLIDKIPWNEEDVINQENGEDIKIWFEITEDDKLPKDDADKVIVGLPNYIIGRMIKVQLFTQLGDDTPEMIDKLKGDITFKLQLPDKLINEDKNIKREYKVVEKDSGKILDTKYDDDSKSIIIKIDKLTEYIIVYEDIVLDTPEAAPGIVDTPVAGDGVNVASWCVVLLMMGIVAMYPKRGVKSE